MMKGSAGVHDRVSELHLQEWIKGTPIGVLHMSIPPSHTRAADKVMYLIVGRLECESSRPLHCHYLEGAALREDGILRTQVSFIALLTGIGDGYAHTTISLSASARSSKSTVHSVKLLAPLVTSAQRFDSPYPLISMPVMPGYFPKGKLRKM